MEELDYEFHKAQFKDFIELENKETSLYFTKRAIHMHTLTVSDAVLKAQTDSLILSGKLANEEAAHFLRYGVGRRLGHIWAAYRNMLEVVPIDRVEGLSGEEVKSVSRDLNSLYINIIGTIDNYAWCLRYERESDSLKKLKDIQIGLFSPKFINDPSFSDIKSEILMFGGWSADIRKFRNPAAHRIPLSVPPAILNAEEGKEYAIIENKINDALLKHEFELIDELRSEQRKLGKFKHIFIHHPKGPHVALFPTIPQDIGNMLKIMQVVHKFLA